VYAIPCSFAPCQIVLLPFCLAPDATAAHKKRPQFKYIHMTVLGVTTVSVTWLRDIFWTEIFVWTESLIFETNILSSYVYWTVHHCDS